MNAIFSWRENAHSCNEYIPKPEPGRIEPIDFVSKWPTPGEMIDKINELINAWNRRER